MIFKSSTVGALVLNKWAKYLWKVEFFKRVLEWVLKYIVMKKRAYGSEIKYHARSISEVERWETLMEEEKVIEKTLQILNEEDVFLDIGANIGVYSCFVLSYMEGTTNVISIEPEEKNYSSLVRNLKLNFPEGGWMAKKICVSNYSGKGMLKKTDDKPGAGGHYLNDSYGEKVEVKTINNLVQNNIIPKPDVVKIDIEGNELEALNGFGDLIDSVKNIICEVHNKNESLIKYKKFASRNGFDIEILHERPESWQDVHILLTR